MTGTSGLRTPSAGFDRGWTKIPYQRLHPVDLYHMLDWVRDGWEDDELFVTPRLQRLKWHLEELPERYQPRIRRHYLTLTRARIAVNEPWQRSLADLRRLVSEWGRSLPA